MLPVVTACLLLSPALLVAGYNTKGRFYNELSVFPMLPIQPQMLPYQTVNPGQFPVYQNEAPFLPAPPAWLNMHMPQNPFIHPPGCDIDIPFHQHNMEFLGSPFIGQNQLAKYPFQDPGQWKQAQFPQGQGQWKENFPNNGQGHWNQNSFPNGIQGQWKPKPFPNQGQGQWKQPMARNTNKNVNIIGQWDGLPVTNQMLSQPAISGLTPKGQQFKGPTQVAGTGPVGFDAPVQSRRLR